MAADLTRHELQTRLTHAKGMVRRLLGGARSNALRLELVRVTDDLDGIEAVLDDGDSSPEVLAATHRALSLAERMLAILELPDHGDN